MKSKLISDNLAEILTRFSLGGLAVVGCYLLSFVIPWKIVAGLFAAFPAVMIASVALTGRRDGDKMAGEVAQGAVAGMIGCALCVIAAIFFIRWTGKWLLGIGLSVPVWVISSMTVNRLQEKFYRFRMKRKAI
ncbi:DUF3147 family protein [Thermincola potens]|uniref:DUF3147 family protein n=1 Tax=Thermincola potens (strain JR) TaxID=635013 RepID=D5XBI7_THEPJ|nr:DUF3147 family protein [Thermincola potens]ADG83416.1 conserved hypothetical protein [Thermincola potens JR]